MKVGRLLRGMCVVLVAGLVTWGLQGCKSEEEGALEKMEGAAEEVQEAAEDATE